jgi:uncharacterized protein (TIGR01244 family)
MSVVESDTPSRISPMCAPTFDGRPTDGRGNVAIMRTLFSAVLGLAMMTAVLGGQVTKESVPGITNFSQIETTIACAGATTPGAVAEVKRMGYRSIINLRQANEAGADLAAEEAAAKAAAITYVHLPFNTAAPDLAIVEKFLAAVTAPANQPAFVHCASANRASALWMIKRLVVDGWDAERASTEAAALGLSNAALKTFALEYAAARKK